MRVDVSNQTVLVTGASRGIGRAIALKFAEAGASVAAHYFRNEERAQELASVYPDRIDLFQADLAEAAECEALFGRAQERFGRVHTLVNNAGVAVSMPMRMELSDWTAAWHRTMAVNLCAAELLCRQAILHFREHAGGRIINIASRAAFRGDTPEYMTYAASKGGLVALTRSIARGFGKNGVRAFIIAPGFVRTDMAQDFIDTYGEEYALRGVATERLTEPADVAPTVVFLASGLADHATGTTIDVNAASYLH